MSVAYDAARWPCSNGPRGAPGLLRLQEWTLAEFGGSPLGIYNCRPVRSGTAPSKHANGEAFDWQPAPVPSWLKRLVSSHARTADQEARAALEQYFAALIAYADELNVQAIHDYDRGMRWLTGHGWQRANIGAGVRHGTHVERNRAGAADARPIAQIIAATHTPAPPSQPPPRRRRPCMLEQPIRPNEIAERGPRNPLRPQVARPDEHAGNLIWLHGGASVLGDARFGDGLRYVTIPTDDDNPIVDLIRITDPTTGEVITEYGKAGFVIVTAKGHGHPRIWS